MSIALVVAIIAYAIGVKSSPESHAVFGNGDYPIFTPSSKSALPGVESRTRAETGSSGARLADFWEVAMLLRHAWMSRSSE